VTFKTPKGPELFPIGMLIRKDVMTVSLIEEVFFAQTILDNGRLPFLQRNNSVFQQKTTGNR
jgi:hypothetical protein